MVDHWSSKADGIWISWTWLCTESLNKDWESESGWGGSWPLTFILKLGHPAEAIVQGRWHLAFPDHQVTCTTLHEAVLNSLTIMSCIAVICPSSIVTGTGSSWWKTWRQRVTQTLSLVPWVGSWFFWLPGHEQGCLEGLYCFHVLTGKTSYTTLFKSSGCLAKFCLRISQFIHVAWKVHHTPF